MENPNIKKFYQQSTKPFNYVPSDLVEGFPTIPPIMSGLMRIDPEAGNIWISAGNTLVSDWKLITGGGGGGGLTSVGLTMPAAFTVTNSPLTANGSITITGAGTSGQYIDGTGALQSFPAITTYDSNQGIEKNSLSVPPSFQLGSRTYSSSTSIPFLLDRYIYNDTYSLNFYGRPSSGNMINIVSEAGTTSSRGISIDYTISSKSSAIYAKVPDGGIALEVLGSGTGFDITQSNNSSLKTYPALPGIVSGLQITNNSYNGFGDGIKLDLGGTTFESYYADSTQKSNLRFLVRSYGAGASVVALELDGTQGQVIFNQYGQTPAKFLASPVRGLGVDISGNVVEYSPPRSTTVVLQEDVPISLGGGWTTIVPSTTSFSVNLYEKKSYTFKAVILYEFETGYSANWSTGWFPNISGSTFLNSGFYYQVWDGLGAPRTFPNLSQVAGPPTPTTPTSSYQDLFNTAIIEGVLSEADVDGTMGIQVTTFGVGGAANLYIRRGSSITIYETP
jgi:hypothetical protein